MVNLPSELTWICVALLFFTNITAIRVISRDVTVAAGDEAQLFCQLVETTEDLTSVTWQRRTKEKTTNTDFMVITSDGKVVHRDGLTDRVTFTGDFSGLIGSVLLSNVTVLDEGIYTCIFNVFPSGPYNGEIRLTVLVPPVVTVSTDKPPVAGDTEEILATCTAANAKPAANVTWSLADLSDSVKVQTNITVDSEGRSTVKSSLIGVASKHLNQKKVQCLVTHPGLKETLTLDYTLIIHYPPQVVYITSAGDKGETREFQCEFQCEGDANPKPTNFTWSRHFPVKELLSSGVNSRLIIPQTPDSNGLYCCVVSNEYGEAVGSIYVHVTPPTECTTCWTLFIILLILVLAVSGGFVIKKTKLHQECLHFIDRLRHDPVDH